MAPDSQRCQKPQSSSSSLHSGTSSTEAGGGDHITEEPTHTTVAVPQPEAGTTARCSGYSASLGLGPGGWTTSGPRPFFTKRIPAFGGGS